MEIQAKFPDHLLKEQAYEQDQMLRRTLLDGAYDFLLREYNNKINTQRERLMKEAKLLPVYVMIQSFVDKYNEMRMDINLSREYFDNKRRKEAELIKLENKLVKLAREYDPEINRSNFSINRPEHFMSLITTDYVDKYGEKFDHPNWNICRAKIALIPNVKKETFESIVDKIR